MKKFKKYVFILFAVLFLLSSLILVSCRGEGDEAGNRKDAAAESSEREILYYTCGMHPSVKISPEDYEQGNTKCPICNMDVVPVYKESPAQTEGHEEHDDMAVQTPEIKLSPRAQTLAQVITEEWDNAYPIGAIR